MLAHLVRQTKICPPPMRASKASKTVKVLSATLGDSSCRSLPSSSSSSSSEHEVMLTVTFSKKPVGKNSSSMTGTSGSCSRRSIGRILCLLTFLDFSFPLKWQGLFFLPCLFLRQRGGNCAWLCFLGLRRVTRIHPSSSTSALSETTTKGSVSVKSPLDPIGITIGSKLSNWIVINFSPKEEINSVFTLLRGWVCFGFQGNEEHSS